MNDAGKYRVSHLKPLVPFISYCLLEFMPADEIDHMLVAAVFLLQLLRYPVFIPSAFLVAIAQLYRPSVGWLVMDV